jgi:hypothetical protein
VENGYVTDLHVRVSAPPPERTIYRLLYAIRQLPFLVTHLLGVGGPEETTTEAQKFQNVPGCIVDDDLQYGIREARLQLKNAFNQVVAVNGGFRYKFEDCLNMKPEDKAVGEPLNRYGAYGKILEKFTREGVVEWLHARAVEIQQYAGHISMFTVFSKVDKYKIGKIEEGRFRTIQSSPLLLQMMMLRHLRTTEKQLKVQVPEFGALGMTCDQYHSVIGQHELKHVSIGYDITGMDRAMPAYLILSILSVLDAYVGPATMSYITSSICYGPLVDTDGHVLYRSGGNPSGQNWTTVLNCLVNYAMNKAVQRRLNHTFDFRVVGDDGIVWFSNPQILPQYQQAMDEIAAQCNFEMKWQTEPAPPGEGTVFLDTICKVWKCESGLETTFGCPARVERSLPKLYQQVDRPEDVARGLLDRLSVLYYWNRDNGYTQPTSLRWLLQEAARRYGVGIRSREAVEELFIRGKALFDPSDDIGG